MSRHFQSASSSRSWRALHPAAGLLLLLSVATCSPEYQSGVTACAATNPKCPDGFECRGIRCYAIGTAGGPSASADGGTAGSGGSSGLGGAAPVTGSGGRGGSAPPATAGSPGTAGRGGSAPPMPPMPPPGMAARCGELEAEDQCDDCAFKSCCSQIQACLTAQTCNAFLDCLDECEDDPSPEMCVMMCTTSNQAGSMLFRTAIQCQNSMCAAQCSSAPPTMPPPTTTPPPASGCSAGLMSTSPCTRCFSGVCCNEFLACSNSAECSTLVRCRNMCMDEACRTTCNNQSPNGVPILLQFAQCSNMKCSVECSGS
jgi:hypothetical protein